MNDSFTIRDLPREERPRERLLKFGPEALSITELLSVILGRGTAGYSVTSISHQLLNKHGNLKNLSELPISELSKIKGIGPAKAAQLIAAFELGKRAGVVDEKSGSVAIASPADVLKVIKTRLKGKKREHFLALYLDTRNHIIEIETVSIGSLNSSIVHPRETFKGAIKLSAASIVFVHNHPSGNTEPSQEDIQLTKRLVESGNILGIDVLDHIIVCDNDYLSMKTRNLL